MSPGRQHQILPGCSSKSSNQFRYSVSFRKFKPELVPDHYNETSTINEVPSTTSVPATLLLGDPFPAHKDKGRLSKNMKVVINIAKGGSRIPDVIQSIEDFKNNIKNADFAKNQVFVCEGSNDIRNCDMNEVFHLFFLLCFFNHLSLSIPISIFTNSSVFRFRSGWGAFQLFW